MPWRLRPNAVALPAASGRTVPWRTASERTVPWQAASELSRLRPKRLERLVRLDAQDAIIFFPDALVAFAKTQRVPGIVTQYSSIHSI